MEGYAASPAVCTMIQSHFPSPRNPICLTVKRCIMIIFRPIQGTVSALHSIAAQPEGCLTPGGVLFRNEGQGHPFSGQYILPNSIPHEGDWYYAAPFLCAGALAGKGVTVTGLQTDSVQNEKSILFCLALAGAQVKTKKENVSVSKGETYPIYIELKTCPRLMPLLAVTACGIEGKSTLSFPVQTEGDKEKTAALVALIASLGGTAKIISDGLEIHGTGALVGGKAQVNEDPDLMMAAVLASVISTSPVEIPKDDILTRIFPTFRAEWNRLQIDQNH
ncbi:MAG TPA: hypothetical protein DCY75_08350 [Clostridiales bacterium]|nr:hypothetical protein [Clostridiales bacterium]